MKDCALRPRCSALLRPPTASPDVVSSRLVEEAIEQRKRAGPIVAGAHGQRSVAALVDLHAALSEEPAFAAFATTLPHVPEAEGGWYAATTVAKDAAVDDSVGHAIAFLLGERSTSLAGESPFAVALAVAAAEIFGVGKPELIDGSSPHTAEVACRLAADSYDAFRNFFDAQRQLTAHLFAGAPYLLCAGASEGSTPLTRRPYRLTSDRCRRGRPIGTRHSAWSTGLTRQKADHTSGC